MWNEPCLLFNKRIEVGCFFQWKSSLCLRPFPWRRCRGREPELAGWRSRRGIDQSETSLLVELTSLLKRTEPLVRRRTLERWGIRCNNGNIVIKTRNPCDRLSITSHPSLCFTLRSQKPAQTSRKDTFGGRFHARSDRDELRRWGEWIHPAMAE